MNIISISIWTLNSTYMYSLLFTAGPLMIKKPTNKLKIRILSKTSILYLIHHASVIRIVGFHL